MTKVPPFLGNQTKLSLYKVPSFIQNWMVLALLFLFLTILSIGFFLKFPSKIVGEVIISNDQPDLAVVSKNAGRVNLLVENKQYVNQGETLGYFLSDVKIEDINMVESWATSINVDSYHAIPLLSQSLKIGHMQLTYGQLVNDINTLKYDHSNGLVLQQIQTLEEQIVQIEKKVESLNNSRGILEEDLKLSQKNFDIDQNLNSQGVLSDYDFNQKKSRYLEKRNRVQEIGYSIAENNALMQQTTLSIIHFKNEISQKAFKLKQNTIARKKQLLASIRQWKETNVLVAPADGIVNFTLQTEGDFFASEGETVLFVISELRNGASVKLKTNSLRIGEIKPGQKVIIKLDSYPYQKFGVLLAQVKGINEKQERDQLLIELDLINDLSTSSNYKVDLIEDMTGYGEIILSEDNFYQRILSSLNKWQH